MPDAPSDSVPSHSAGGALDELYAVRPEEFVAARDRLAKQLRADGDAAAAQEVRARRRPNMVAWSVNQVARARGDLLDALFTAADDLRAAITAGDGDALRAAMRAQRTWVGELTDAALERAAEVSPNASAHRDAIAGTWEAAAGDEASRQLVTEAQLTTELLPTLALGDAPVAAPSSAPAPRARGKLPRSAVAEPRRATLPRDELALRRAEETLAEARAELADAMASVEAADEDLERATRAIKRANDARDRAQRRVTRAEQSVEERRAR